MTQYSQAFLHATDHIFAWEGGYSDHPHDPGGATKFGITHKTLKSWRNRPTDKTDVANLSRDEALPIYYQRYWLAIHGDDFPEPLAILIMDAAVNSGPKNAAKALQQTLRTSSVASSNISIDGIIGRKTIAAVSAAVTDARDLDALMIEFINRRAVFYGSLKTFRTFGLGWMRRLHAGFSLATKLCARRN